MNIFKARHNNAVRIAEKINALIDAGHVIFDEKGELLTGRFVIDEDGDVLHAVSDRCNIGYYMTDTDLDNGAHTTIADYNAQFADWTFIHPKHKKTLFPKRKPCDV